MTTKKLFKFSQVALINISITKSLKDDEKNRPVIIISSTKSLKDDQKNRPLTITKPLKDDKKNRPHITSTKQHDRRLFSDYAC